MRSMTGFGQASAATEKVNVTVEMRTVNSRYLDLNLRLPKELSFLELELRKKVQTSLRRGRVDIYVELIVKSGSQSDLNEAVAENYLATAEKIKILGVKGTLDVSTLLQLPGVIVSHPVDLTAGGLLETIHETFTIALEKLVSTRSSEGTELKKGFLNYIETLNQLTGAIDQHAKEVHTYHRRKLTKNFDQFKEEAVVDEARLAQEIIHHADKSDITEEITRLRSHISHFVQELKGAESEAVGRRLDFIAQEMGREMNTILSKSPFAELSKLALEGKTEIEKIREQMQNVE